MQTGRTLIDVGPVFSRRRTLIATARERISDHMLNGVLRTESVATRVSSSYRHLLHVLLLLAVLMLGQVSKDAAKLVTKRISPKMPSSSPTAPADGELGEDSNSERTGSPTESDSESSMSESPLPETSDSDDDDPTYTPKMVMHSQNVSSPSSFVITIYRQHYFQKIRLSPT